MKLTLGKFPLVTVAVVTYNSSEYVATAINSVLASDYSNIEIVIVDDNSIDKTWEIINAYSDNRIKAVKNDKNLGEYQNRNKCIDIASGDYFIFIDGDDYLYPHGISQLISASQINSEASMIIARPESDHMIYPVCLTPEQVFKYEFLGQGLLSQGFPSTLFKTKILKHHRLSTDYVSGDTYIKHLLGFTYPVILTTSGVAWWRRTPGQASEKIFYSVRGLIEAKSIKKKFLNLHKSFLTEAEYISADKRIQKPLLRRLLKSILKFNFYETKLILNAISFNDILWSSIFYKHTHDYKIADARAPITSVDGR